jgi:hypothetical protein
MAGKKTYVGKVTLEYLIRFQGRPKRQIAKVLHKDHPDLFLTLNAAESAVNYYTGSLGKKNRKYAQREGTIRPLLASPEQAWDAIMPESWSEPIPPFVLPSGIHSLLVLSDIHVPYHDISALHAAISFGILRKPDAVLLNGDTLDFYSISDHEKDPRKVKWNAELEAGRQVLRMIRKAFPNVPVYFKEGNHEYRMERHLMKHAPVLIGMPEFELPVLMRMGEVGVEYIRNKRMIHAGGLTIGHGDEWRGAGGVNPGRWVGLRAKESMMIGHFHRVSEHIERTVRGDVRGYWSTGCLCELQPAYMPYNEWAHGFALVHLNADGSFEVENKKIINGVVR